MSVAPSTRRVRVRCGGGAGRVHEAFMVLAALPGCTGGIWPGDRENVNERSKDRTSPAGAAMVPMTAEQRAQVNARLDELLEDIRDLARRLDVVTTALPAVSA